MLLIFRIHFDLIVPRNSSIKDILSNPQVFSIMTSVIGRGNSSLGQAAFRMKLDENSDLPILLRDGNETTQSGCYSSLTKLESMSFLTFDSIASIISGKNRCCFCLTSSCLDWYWGDAWLLVGQVQTCPHSSKRRHLYIHAWDVLGLLSGKVISYHL